MYLSEQIEAMAKKGKTTNKSLVMKTYSCGIFQNYDHIEAEDSRSDTQAE